MWQHGGVDRTLVAFVIMHLMAEEDDQEIPPELLESPSGEAPAPLPLTAQQTLPFNGLLWTNFERLCLRLARLDGNPGCARLYGNPGQLQYGIDFYIVLPSGRYQVASHEPGDLRLRA